MLSIRYCYQLHTRQLHYARRCKSFYIGHILLDFGAEARGRRPYQTQFGLKRKRVLSASCELRHIPKHAHEAPPAFHPTVSMSEACSRMDLTATQQIIVAKTFQR